MKSALGAVLVCAACSRNIPPNQVVGLVGQSVEVTTWDDREVEATVIKTANGIEFKWSDRAPPIPLAYVEKVEKTSGGMGALKGFLGGFVGVGGFFALAVLADSGSEDTEEALLIGSLFAAAGGATGAVIGGIVGDTDVYRMPLPNAPQPPTSPLSFRF